MKKTLRTILAMAISLIAVSCYDDSALNSKIDDLNTRLTALEAKLNADLANLKTTLEAQVEEQLEALAGQVAEGGEELEGRIEELEGVAEGIANLKFDISEDFELLYSITKEESWIQTGAFINEETGITASQLNDDNTLTISFGEASVTLPLYVEDTSIIAFPREGLFLRYSGSKTLELEAEGLSDCYVMSKPDGWKAVLEDKSLTLTAPTAAAVKIGAAETEGLVLIHATVAGRCKVAELPVEAGKGLTLELDTEGNLVVTNSYYSEKVVGEVLMTTFDNFYIGRATPEEFFKTTPEDYLNAYNPDLEFPDMNALSGQFYNNQEIDFKQYKEGEYEIDVIETTLFVVFEKWLMDVISYAEPYVIWIAPQDEEGFPDADAVEYVKYTRMDYEVEVVEVTHNDASLSMNLKGADKYIIGYTDNFFEPNFTLQQYLEEADWNMIKNAPAEEIGNYFYCIDAGEYKGDDVVKISQVRSMTRPASLLNFGTKYYCWVFPYIDGTEYTDYVTQFAPYVFEFTTNEYQAGSESTVQITGLPAEFKKVSATLTPSEGATVYYSWYSSAAWAALEAQGDEAIVDDLLSYGSETSSERNCSKNASPGTSWILAALPVDTVSGEYGEYETEVFTTLPLPTVKNTELTITIADQTATYSDVTVPITVSSLPAYYRYCTEAEMEKNTTEEALVSFLINNGTSITATSASPKKTGSAGTAYTLVVLSVDSNDMTKYNISTKEVSINSYPYDESISLSYDSVSESEDGNISLKVKVEGEATHVTMYYYYQDSSGTSTAEKNAIKDSPTVNDKYAVATVANGEATLTIKKKALYPWGYITAYVKNADGVTTALAKTPISVNINEELAKNTQE